jgi:predicted nucleic acid-binding protein
VIVVADTTPINYLILIDTAHLLPALYQKVLIPASVRRELLHDGSPARVSAWARSLPGWCQSLDLSSPPDPSLADLDEGERDAIHLALEQRADILLMDDLEGRRAAIAKGISIIGTVAFLEKCSQQGLIDFREAFARLGHTNSRISSAIRQEFLDRNP